MCLICVELTNDKLSSKEARNNVSEMRTSIPEEHVSEVLKLIWKKEDDEYSIEYGWNEEYGDTD